MYANIPSPLRVVARFERSAALLTKIFRARVATGGFARGPQILTKCVEANREPSVAAVMVRFLRSAMDFATQEAFDAYLLEHPRADKSNHRVVENPRETSSEEEEEVTRLSPNDDLPGKLVHGKIPRGPSVYYRGSNSAETEIREGAYFTEVPEHATPYVHNSGHLFSVEFDDDLNIADEETVKRIAEDIGVSADVDRVWGLTENKKVRAALKEEGFDVVDFEDEGPHNMYQHSGRMVINPKCVRLVGSNRVFAADD